MFVNLVACKNISYKYALGMRDTVGKEFHTFHEIFFFLGGSARFTSDRNIERIVPNTVIIIPKGCFHQYDPLCEEKYYLRGVLQFDSLPGDEECYGSILKNPRIMQNPSQKVMNICKRMNELSCSSFDKGDQEKLLHAYFTELMIELKYNIPEKHKENHMDPDISTIITYIDEHCLEHISVAKIAKKLNFSESTISHKFQKVFHISVYNYIMRKKLTYAYGMIIDGRLPTEVAYECGFSDYSGFYKMYKKYFGFSPSDTHRLL